MILQSLVERYNKSTEAMAYGWGKYNIQYAVCIDDDGKVDDILTLGGADEKGKLRPVEKALPLRAGRSGIKAYFLSDFSEYLLGFFSSSRLDDDVADFKKKMKKPKDYQLTDEELSGITDKIAEEAQKKRAASQSFHLKVLKKTDSPAANALKRFFEAENPCESWLESNSDFKHASGSNFIFMYDGEFLDFDGCDQAIKDAWAAYLDEESARNGEKLCLVSGVKQPICRLHNPIPLRGVTMGGKPLISMNDQTSFRSYGDAPKDPPCQIGEKSMFAYTSALNDLMKSGRNTISLGGDTVVFWSDYSPETEELFMTSLRSSDDEILKSIMEKISSGVLVEADKNQMNSTFYVICFSPNAARISVRFFYKNSFGKILNNISEHYKNLEIVKPVNDKFEYLPYWTLLSETTVSKKSADVEPLLGGQLLKSIITGARYPATFLNSIVVRCRIEKDINRTKAAAIKAVLTRNDKEREAPTMSLNKESNDVPYVLGRLFSVLEQLQEKAAGSKLNSTIKDKYFASACANPSTVFPVLLKLSMTHASKLDDAARWFEIQKGEIMDKLDDDKPFPSALSLEDQGRFIVGYYQQTQARYASKQNNEEKGE